MSSDDYDPLRILFYVGKADGQLRLAEKAIIRDVCAVMHNGSRMTDAVIEDFFAKGDGSRRRTFELAFRRKASRNEPSRLTVLSAAEKIIATQKTVHPAEQEALDFIRGHLAGASSLTSSLHQQCSQDA